MAHQQTRQWSHSEFRHRAQTPLPPLDDVAPRWLDVLNPSWLAPRQLERRDPRPPDRLIRRRQRRLTRPVMVAILVRLVWRRVPSIAEVQKVLSRAGVLGVAPLRVSPQALTKRRDVRPAAVMGQLLAEVCTRLQAPSPPPVPQPRWAPVAPRFPLVALVEGSTLAARRQTTAVLQRCEGRVWGGTMMVRVAAFSHRPRWQLDTADAAANDQRVATELWAALPPGGLLGCDLGLCSCLGFDDCTQGPRCFVTRMREKTAYRTRQVLSQGVPYRDDIIPVGQYRSNPCTHPRRLVSVLWQGAWYRSVTNGLEPQAWSARQVCELSRRRWRLAEAFALTKRLLDVAYVWTGSTNAIPLPIHATLIFSTVRVTIWQPVAQALGEPLERLSVEMVFRAFYHDSRAVQRGESDDLVALLAEHATLLGMVNRGRKQHHERQPLESIIGGDPSVETSAPEAHPSFVSSPTRGLSAVGFLESGLQAMARPPSLGHTVGFHTPQSPKEDNAVLPESS